MKILGICSSPRLEGNTNYYLSTVLSEAKRLGADTEIISLAGRKISGCNGCYGCVEAKKCIIEDDFQEIFNKIVEADGLLLASPVYHSCITPELKCVLDRAGFSGRWAKNEMKETKSSYDWKGSALSGKVVAPVTVARRAGQNFAFAEILLWASANDCIIVGNTYWNVGVAGKGGAVNADEDEEGIGIMNRLAANMVNVIKKLNA
ncbi:MAG: flavodoxin family protein [Sedimentibacter sp.]